MAEKEREGEKISTPIKKRRIQTENEGRGNQGRREGSREENK